MANVWVHIALIRPFNCVWVGLLGKLSNWPPLQHCRNGDWDCAVDSAAPLGTRKTMTASKILRGPAELHWTEVQWGWTGTGTGTWYLLNRSTRNRTNLSTTHSSVNWIADDDEERSIFISTHDRFLRPSSSSHRVIGCIHCSETVGGYAAGWLAGWAEGVECVPGLACLRIYSV